MVTVRCDDTQCRNNGIDYVFRGHPSFVECGGCHVILTPFDLRDDPPIPDDDLPVGV